MSVYEGTAIEKVSYKFPGQISDNHLLSIYGPINQEDNIGKYVPRNIMERFVKLCKCLSKVLKT